MVLSLLCQIQFSFYVSFWTINILLATQISVSLSEPRSQPACVQRFSSLAAGGGIAKARTGGELPIFLRSVPRGNTPACAKLPVARRQFIY